MRLARIAAMTAILFVPLAQADELYKFTATVDGRTTRFGFQTTQEAVDVFSTTDLSRFVAGYTGAEAVRIDVDYRGLPITTAFPNRFGGPANYAELRFAIPSSAANGMPSAVSIMRRTSFRAITSSHDGA